ncbi:MAG TPA: hypothetical protein VJU18_12155 [Vicinamibacteria bacterium]|nr:hypothetical protein [Vicinamibacteria bacterium]
MEDRQSIEQQQADLTRDRIALFLPPDQLTDLRRHLSNDELWTLAHVREVKEHGHGRVVAEVHEGEVVNTETTLQRRRLGTLALAMGV